MGWLDQLIDQTRAPDRRVAVLLLLFCATLYIPFAGNYGLWDPWETHYSEVARQMMARHDYVSLMWPGSPQDRNEFWSKPVLTFWLMVLGFFATGIGKHPPSLGLDPSIAKFDGEMAVGWTAEWAVRIPFILCGIACVWAVWELTRRLTNRRAGFWAGVVLATSSQFFYIARQAMTDMAFVAPMAVALSMAGLALLLPAEEVEAALPRRGPGIFSWPHTIAFYVLVLLCLFTVVPQLIMISAEVQVQFMLGHKLIRLSGVVPMLPWIATFVVFLFFAIRARCRREIYLQIAFLMCGLATLAKGPAGVAMPAFVILVYLLGRGEWRRLLPPAGDESSPRWADRVQGWPGFAIRFVARNPLEIGLGLLIFVAVTFPWYHAMLIRHGSGFWNEFIGDNYVHRAAGRHGDRGTFEYYFLQIGHGMFPWSGVVPAAALMAIGKLGGETPRTRLRAFAMAWFVVMFAVVSLVNTKFHHYILPGLPALAILSGLYLDELFERPRVQEALALLLVGVPFLGLAGRDLAMFPARLTWLFDYDYVNAPNGGRPWPQEPQYEYGETIAIFVAIAVAMTALLGGIALWRAKRGVATDSLADITPPKSILLWIIACAYPVVATFRAETAQPAFGNGEPHPLKTGWIIVAVFAGTFLLYRSLRGLQIKETRLPTIGLLGIGMFACAWTGWGLDRLLTDLSPHWSQKHVVAAYYTQRKSADEPLIAWQMYWRGENFYSKNAIYDLRLPQTDKTVFLGDHNAEKMQTWFKTHGGRRVFFIVERSRFESLRSLLPESARPSLQAVDSTNNKIYLAVATLPPSEPPPATPPAKTEKPQPAP